MRQQNNSEPHDYIGNVSNLAEEAFRTMAPNQAPSRPSDNAGTVALAQFSAKVQREVYQQQLELNEARRDNASLDKENEDLRSNLESKDTSIADLMKKITEETTAHVKALGEIEAAHLAAINEMKETHRGEKTELEGKVTASETKIVDLEKQVTDLTSESEQQAASAQRALDERTTELQTKIDELTAANATLTTEKEATELRANQLAAGKKGLPVPPAGVAVVKNASQGAAAGATAGAPSAGAVLTTQQGDPHPPAQIVAPALGVFQGSISEEDEQMIEVLTEFNEMREAATNPDGMARFTAFRNQPKRGCEGCEQDPKHHAKLITKAMSPEHRSRLTSMMMALST